MKRIGETANGMLIVEMTAGEWKNISAVKPISIEAPSTWAGVFFDHVLQLDLGTRESHPLQYLVGSMDEDIWRKVSPWWKWDGVNRRHYCFVAKILFSHEGQLLDFFEWAKIIHERKVILQYTRNVGKKTACDIVMAIDKYIAGSINA